MRRQGDASTTGDLPLVSVVIPTYQRAGLLRACLLALQAQTLGGHETIVVDNASSDGTCELVRRQFPEVRLVELQANVGFGAAVNAGARAAAGEYLAFLNNDALPRPDWLAELVACAQRHPEAAAIASKILRRAEPSMIDGAGDCLTLALKAYRRGLGERDGGRYSEEEQVFAVSGTACLWRTDAFHGLGGFDESYFAYYEDVDLGFRSRLAGYTCWFAPRAVVLHDSAGTSRSDWSTFESFHAVRNRWLMIAKDAPARWLALNLHRILLAELMSLTRALIRGEVSLVLRAYVDVIRSRPRLREQRAQVQKAARASYRDLRALAPRSLPPLRMAWWRFRWSSPIHSDEARGVRGPSRGGG
jgi:N-acetylglucosaminyl-diphospho-decaprenol L-rhamnosyltransferase